MTEHQCPAHHWAGGRWVQCILLEDHAYPRHFNAELSWEGPPR